MRKSANEQTEKIEGESWQLIDNIPGFIAMLTKVGEVEMANRHLLEYFGAAAGVLRAQKYGRGRAGPLAACG